MIINDHSRRTLKAGNHARPFLKIGLYRVILLAVWVLVSRPIGVSSDPNRLLLETPSHEQQRSISCLIQQGFPPADRRRVILVGNKQIAIDLTNALLSPSSNVLVAYGIEAHHGKPVLISMMEPKVGFPTYVGTQIGESVGIVPFAERFGLENFVQAQQPTAAFGQTLLPLHGPFEVDALYASQDHFEVFVARDTNGVEISATIFHELVHVKLPTIGHTRIDAQTKLAEDEARSNATHYPLNCK